MQNIMRFIKFILNSIFSILLFPFKFVFGLFSKVLKRFRFSIAFKISTSYVILYIVVIFIVALLTSISYFIYEIDIYEQEIMQNDFNNIIDIFPDYEKINDIIGNNEIQRIYIYDDNLDSIYSSYGRMRYSDNIISVLENLFYYNEYVYASSFVYNYSRYYVNIHYSVVDLLYETERLIIMILISGALGMLVFVPIVSRTSYRVMGPIKRMTDITKTITVNNINTRLDLKDTQDELKELSETFNEMMDRIEEGYKSQQQFVSDASHELRTPIAVVKGYVNMLDRWGKNDKEVLNESIGAIKNETDNMQDLIEKLLFIARSDKQTLAFTKEDFKIFEVLHEIEKETSIIDTNHNFQFKFYDDVLLYADKNRIKQMVRIFIENAIKYTPQGGSIDVTGYTDGEYYVISISDTGIGIAKKDLNKIFDRLYRAEQSRNKEIGGHGLGLSIAKIIILGHKGKIKVKSTLGKGTEFLILLPYLKNYMDKPKY